MSDIRLLLKGVKRPTVFDVGANVGQSVNGFRKLLPDCETHSFEPSPSTFRKLADNTRGLADVHLANVGVGSSSGQQVLFENDHSAMNSFLWPGEMAGGTIVRQTVVKVTTLDEYCSSHGIDHIDVLKTDTQGYDFEVIKGSESLIEARKIHLLFMEVIFSEQYEGLPQFDEMYRFLIDRGFRLVAFYGSHMQNRLLSWSDLLFVNPASRTS